MSERGRNIAVGITFLVGMACLGGILVRLGYFRSTITPEKGYHVKVILPSTGGLELGSLVTRGGYAIGRVDDIQLEQNPPFLVEVRLFLRDWAQVPMGVKTRVDAPLFGGSPSLELETSGLAGQEKVAFLPKDGSGVIQGAASSLTGNIQASLLQAQQRFEQVAQDFKATAQSIQQLSTQWTTVGQNINQLVEPRRVEAVDAGQVAGNVSTVVTRTDQRLKEMQKAIDGLNTYLSDAKLHDDIRQGANMRQLTDKINGFTDKVQEVVDSAGKNVERLTTRFHAVADDLSGAVNAARKAIDDARTGNGTLGKLVHDSQLYDNLNDAARRLKDALGEVKTLVEKIRTEGLAVKY